MTWVYAVIGIVVALLLVFVIIPVIRAVRFRPKKEKTYPDFPVQLSAQGTLRLERLPVTKPR